MVKHSHPLSVISGGVTSVPLVVVFLIVRRDTVTVGMILVPVIHINPKLPVLIDYSDCYNTFLLPVHVLTANTSSTTFSATPTQINEERQNGLESCILAG